MFGDGKDIGISGPSIYGMARLDYLMWIPDDELGVYWSDRLAGRDKMVIRYEYQFHGNGD